MASKWRFFILLSLALLAPFGCTLGHDEVRTSLVGLETETRTTGLGTGLDNVQSDDGTPNMASDSGPGVMDTAGDGSSGDGSGALDGQVEAMSDLSGSSTSGTGSQNGNPGQNSADDDPPQVTEDRDVIGSNDGDVAGNSAGHGAGDDPMNGMSAASGGTAVNPMLDAMTADETGLNGGSAASDELGMSDGEQGVEGSTDPDMPLGGAIADADHDNIGPGSSGQAGASADVDGDEPVGQAMGGMSEDSVQADPDDDPGGRAEGDDEGDGDNEGAHALIGGAPVSEDGRLGGLEMGADQDPDNSDNNGGTDSIPNGQNGSNSIPAGGTGAENSETNQATGQDDLDLVDASEDLALDCPLREEGQIALDGRSPDAGDSLFDYGWRAVRGPVTATYSPESGVEGDLGVALNLADGDQLGVIETAAPEALSLGYLSVRMRMASAQQDAAGQWDGGLGIALLNGTVDNHNQALIIRRMPHSATWRAWLNEGDPDIDIFSLDLSGSFGLGAVTCDDPWPVEGTALWRRAEIMSRNGLIVFRLSDERRICELALVSPFGDDTQWQHLALFVLSDEGVGETSAYFDRLGVCVGPPSP